MLACLILSGLGAQQAAAQSVDFAHPAAGTGQAAPEAVSLDGKPLYRPDWPAGFKAKLDTNTRAAASDFTLNPDDPNTILWLGRWYGFGSRFNDAIAVFTRGVEKFPGDPQFLRHRGHRYLSTRQFDKASADFRKAADLVADRPDMDEISGVPGAKPSSAGTFKFNLFYHMGVTYFVTADFGKALAAFQECGQFIGKDDDESRVALVDWEYMTLRRLGRHVEAGKLAQTIPEGLSIKDNTAYYQRIRMYKGIITPEQVLSVDRNDMTPEAKAREIATQGYGLGNYYLVEGNTAKAREVFELITAGTEWAAFGFIAAEADLHRMKQAKQ